MTSTTLTVQLNRYNDVMPDDALPNRAMPDGAKQRIASPAAS